MSSQSSTGPKCSICDVTFRRPEHLKRHLRSHTKEKPFQCAHCSRCFSRSDTLHRHDQSYHAPGVSDRIHRITVKTFRACSECAFARVRCSGGEPCHRCQSRTATCQYPTDRRSKRQGASETSRKSTTSTVKMSRHGKNSSTSESTVENSRRQATSDEMQASQRPENDQQFQFRFINYNTSSQTNSINHETESRRQSLSYNNGYAPSLNFNAQSQSPQVQTLNDSQVSFESSLPEAASSQTTAVLPPFNVASQMLLNQTSLSQVQSPVNAAMSLDMPPATNTLDMSLDPVLFSAAEDLGLNWLPIDDFKDISAPLSMDPNATYGVMNEWWLDGLNARQDLPQSAPPADPIPMLNGAEQSASFPLALTPSSHSLGNPSQNTSPSSSNDETSSCGQYYVDGEGARLTKQKRRRNHHMESPEDSEHTSLQHPKRPRLMFPLVKGNLGQELNETGSIRYMPSSTYERILDMFDHFCRSHGLFPAFEPTAFLSPDLLAVLSTAYLDEFQPVYPIFHMPTFDLEKCHWILALTMAAIGSSLLNTSVTAECAFPLHEFARRAIPIEKEKYNSDRKPLWLIQAMLLNCIGLYHGADDQAKDFCLGSMHELVRFAHQEGLIVGYQADKGNGISWNEWIQAESRRRTGYCIWLVDSTLAYTAPDYRPLFTLKDAQAPLPSHESVWDAASEEDWKSLYTGHNLSLHSATEVLFIEKRTIPNICEFDHTLLLHALYQRLWEVSDYHQSPLTCWDPNAARQPRETVISSTPVWLPGVLMYSKWRNSACDCLDTLHWHANGVIAKAAGFEHPTVLHLHAARVVLLVPFREIRNLATSLANGSISWDSRLERNPDWQVAWRWVRHDQYKARLSIVHAGSVFWHVRRYSTNAFQEPISVFLATLALWAYGICSYNSSPPPRSSVPIGRDGQQHLPTQATHHTDQVALDAWNPTFIHLDRPCDDEIVQLYVREGQTMRGNMTGVGDICSLEGPSRVLKEGIRILSSLASTWRITHMYIDILTKLRVRTSMPISAATQG